jgi:hypothetical protein
MAKEEAWHRRHAIQLAGQLPESKEDALAILDAVRRLVTLPGFWDGEPIRKPAGIVRIRAKEGA